MSRSICGYSGAAAWFTARGAFAQTGYPEKAVRVLAPFPARTGADISARNIAQIKPEIVSKGRPVLRGASRQR